MSIFDSIKSTAGVTEKAVIIIGDSSEVEVKEVAAPKPSAGIGRGFSLASLTDAKFDSSLVAGFLADAGLKSDDKKQFEAVGSVKKFKFEVQFNPAEITISGYGGENMPMQTYGPSRNQDEPPHEPPPGPPPKIGSRMAATDTRITMNFKVVFDKTPINNMISKNMGVKAVKAVAGLGPGSVQDEVEALHAVARDDNKRLAMFVWGDMIYEGVINSINSEYVMFKENGEPIRANVNIGMLLYGTHDLGKNIEVWKKEYNIDFYSIKGSTSKMFHIDL
ncbi:CIS tube protein [Butyrivibrio sp. AE3004]|uniref:CIS tube protein n=1 Tax=Butyrivibrio sp. AE3004 TaxID=1506994 RepID=UPI00049442B8|nr:hypothetical protein [Butyrivibrio sp. AE3004]